MEYPCIACTVQVTSIVGPGASSFRFFSLTEPGNTPLVHFPRTKWRVHAVALLVQNDYILMYKAGYHHYPKFREYSRLQRVWFREVSLHIQY